ncbi:MAG: mechanosensitive ion channel domain-containing protein, partial [Cyanobacteria bacterium P01_H01_bin.121]
GARSMVLRTLDHVSIIVPNSQFITSNVINWSYGNPLSRLRLDAPVAYGCDIQTVRSCLLQVADEHPQVIKFPVPKVVFLGYGDNSLNFQLFVWISDPGAQLLVTSDLYFAMETLFREHKVEIPFPQRDLHVRSGSLPIQLSPDLEAVIQTFLERSTPETNGQLDVSAPHPPQESAP